MDKREYFKYYILDVLSRKNKMVDKMLRPMFRVENEELANEYIHNALLDDIPFSMIRPGFVEIDDFCYYDEVKYWPPDGLRKRTKRLRSTFESDSDYELYEESLRANLSDVDAICVYRTFRYKYFCEKYLEKKPIFDAGVLCPIKYAKPWTKALEGKKVLIVSVFSELIEKQYSIIHKVFPEGNPWPNIELTTVQSVWYGSYELRDRRFNSYFDALKYLYEECMKRDFEVALLCCSKLGIDLAPMLKRAGKKAIQMGGDMQIMFGIRGKRWDNNRVLMKYYNDYWVRPDVKETGANSVIVERADDGCYW